MTPTPMPTPTDPTDDSERRARAMWQHTGRQRPAFAVAPAAGEESVWDYPRPPAVARDGREVVVHAGGTLIARSRRAVRVLETASPPTVYVPLADVRTEHLAAAPGASWCEWKGQAAYWSVVVGGRRWDAVAWSYPDPLPRYAALRDHIAFYPAELACTFGGVAVRPQPGRFYGGWVTPELVGPFKGEPGSQGW